VLLALILVLVSLMLYQRQQQLHDHQPKPATDEEKEAGQSQIQLSHVSAMNRYPDEYSAVQQHFLEKKKHNLKKILSFGCATGEEAISLATMYFNDNDIKTSKVHTEFSLFGVDLDQKSIDTAKVKAAKYNPKIEEGKITFFNGKDTEIGEHGPFDAIFANSVLCYYTNPGQKVMSVIQRYPFDAFDSSLGYLDANLNVGGVLAIVNTNYHFSHSRISKKYKPIAQCGGNFVPKVDVKNKMYEDKIDNNTFDCVWLKESA